VVKVGQAGRHREKLTLWAGRGNSIGGGGYQKGTRKREPVMVIERQGRLHQWKKSKRAEKGETFGNKLKKKTGEGGPQ